MDLRTTPLEAVLCELEIPLNHPCLIVFKQPSQPALTKFKNVIRSQRRILAKKYHPDLGHDKKRMQLINNLCDQLLSIKFVYRPPPVQVYYHVHVYSNSAWGTDSSTTTSGGYW